MTVSRYSNDLRINLGTQLGTSTTISIIRNAIRDGSIPVVRQLILTGGDRLDTLSSSVYGEAKYWWILAAGSNIGWGLQAPAGTVINVVNLADVEKIVG